MSPDFAMRFGAHWSGPRASGDEPAAHMTEALEAWWSPRERG